MAKSRFSKPEILAILQKARDGSSITSLCCDNRISGATFYQWRSKFEKDDNPSTPAIESQTSLGPDPSTPDPAKPADSATPTI